MPPTLVEPEQATRRSTARRVEKLTLVVVVVVGVAAASLWLTGTIPVWGMILIVTVTGWVTDAVAWFAKRRFA